MQEPKQHSLEDIVKSNPQFVEIGNIAAHRSIVSRAIDQGTVQQSIQIALGSMPSEKKLQEYVVTIVHCSYPLVKNHKFPPGKDTSVHVHDRGQLVEILHNYDTKNKGKTGEEDHKEMHAPIIRTLITEEVKDGSILILSMHGEHGAYAESYLLEPMETGDSKVTDDGLTQEKMLSAHASQALEAAEEIIDE